METGGKFGFCFVAWLLLNLIFVSTQIFGQQLEDVIYLKNGSIIRGIVIEHVPDTHISIQTREGNLFVYEIGQIDRIMKEPTSKRMESKNTGVVLGLSLGSGTIVDVIYLKNGSIIRGLILEHVPDTHIKIQTREGNLLVYEIGQIDRIMKESTSKRMESKNPGVALGLSLGSGIIVDGAGQFYNGDIGKGTGFVAWSLLSRLLILAATEEFIPFGILIDDDDNVPLALVGMASRIGCYITAAVDAYKSAERRNEEIEYGWILGRSIQSYPRLNLGFGRRGMIFVRYWQSF